MQATTLDHIPARDGQSAAIDALLSRQSCAPRLLTDPAPSDAELRIMADIAVRAPDHGTLRPWRLVCVQGSARQKLGEVFATAYAGRHPSASAEQLQRERAKPLRAPLVIGVAAVIANDHPSVRVVDQQLAIGAAAMNLLNAAHILGYGGMWLTGESCHDPDVKRSLGLAAGDFIAGWIYLGTPKAPPTPRQRAMPEDVLRHWNGAVG